MSTTFIDGCHLAGTPQTAWGRRYLGRLIERRLRRAEREVARQLAWRSDADLQRLGLTPAQIAGIRAKAGTGSPIL